MNRTLAVIEPDAIKKGFLETILTMIIENGFAIKAIKTLSLPEIKAKEFFSPYKEEEEFFNAQVKSMASGTICVIVLEKEDAVRKFKRLMTQNPKIKILSSYRDENVEKEIRFFFSTFEIIA